MPYVDNRRLHYRSYGEHGPWVVLIQGLGLSGEFWLDQPKRLASAGYRVLVPDNRGFGLSARVSRPYRLRQAAADVKAVMDHAGVDKAIIAGISLGGMIAQHVALEYPQSVDALVLMCTTPGLPVGRIPPLKSLALLLASPALLLSRRGAEMMMRIMLAKKNWPRSAELFSSWENLVTSQRADPRSFAFQFLAASTHFPGKRLGSIKCPTLIIAADEDAIFPLPTAYALHRAIPGSRLEIVPNTGHALLMENEDALFNAIEQLSMRVPDSQSA